MPKVFTHLCSGDFAQFLRFAQLLKLLEALVLDLADPLTRDVEGPADLVERAESPYERAAEILTKEALREALENLSYRERRVLELRYGLGGEHPRTLDEVGRTFNVTRERIRQIENLSLKKLQQLGEAQKLREVT